MKEELKPCAACGREDAEVSEVLGAYLIKCACGYKAWDVKLEYAVEYWNARLSTYICNDCAMPCVLKTLHGPEHCICSSDYDAESVNWKLMGEGE